MTDNKRAHRMTEVAPLYALGALSQSEARAFEQHLEEGCGVCDEERRSFQRTVDALGFGAPEADPPDVIRARLLKTVDTEVPSAGEPREFTSIHSAEGEWMEIQAGVLVKLLNVDRATGIATSLVRMLAGAQLPPHEHAGVEQIFVIEGDCNVRGERLGPGDYHRAEAGSVHETTNTVGGTLFLLVAPERYEPLKAQ